MGPSGRWYKSGCSAPSGLAGPQPGSMPACERGGISNGDKHRLIFGDRHIELPHAPLLAIDAKLVCDALGVFVSLASVEAGDEHRASRLMARIGLGDRDVCRVACSPGNVQRPSGPKARICGDDPRCACVFERKTLMLLVMITN